MLDASNGLAIASSSRKSTAKEDSSLVVAFNIGLMLNIPMTRIPSLMVLMIPLPPKELTCKRPCELDDHTKGNLFTASEEGNVQVIGALFELSWEVCGLQSIPGTSDRYDGTSHIISQGSEISSSRFEPSLCDVPTDPQYVSSSLSICLILRLGALSAEQLVTVNMFWPSQWPYPLIASPSVVNSSQDTGPHHPPVDTPSHRKRVNSLHQQYISSQPIPTQYREVASNQGWSSLSWSMTSIRLCQCRSPLSLKCRWWT